MAGLQQPGFAHRYLGNKLKVAVLSAENGWWKRRFFFVLGFVARVYSAIMTPLELGFYKDTPPTIYYIDFLASVFILMNIILRELTVFAHSPEIATFPQYLQRRAGKFFLGLEVMALAPIEWNSMRLVSRHLYYLRIVWLPYFHDVTRYLLAIHRQRYYRIAKTFIYGIYWCHVVACIVYYTARTAEENSATWLWEANTDLKLVHLLDLYVDALYYAAVTLSTVGYGDMSPTNKREKLVFIVIIFLHGAFAVNEVGEAMRGDDTGRRQDDHDGDDRLGRFEHSRHNIQRVSSTMSSYSEPAGVGSHYE